MGDINLTRYLQKDGSYIIPNNVAIRKAVKDEIILPLLLEAGKKIYKQGGNLSKARDGLPKVFIANTDKQLGLSSVSQYIEDVIKNKKNVTKPSWSDRVKVGESKLERKEATTGFGEAGDKQIAFLDEVARLKKNRNQKLSRTKGITARNNINAKFDEAMAKLVHDNRRWFQRVNNRPIKYFPGDEAGYGWQEGDSEAGALRWQAQQYKDAQAEARTWFKKYNIQTHAGHGYSAKGLSITPEQLKELPIDIQDLIRADAKPDPKIKGNLILKGTNSASNLAIEVAKKNLSHGKNITRNIEDLVRLNVAFTKLGSFQEYLNRNDRSYRKSSDFSQAIQSLLLHSKEDIDALQARGEDELLLTGPQEIDRSEGAPYNPKRGTFNKLTEYPGGGEVTIHQYDPGNMPQDGSISPFGKLSTFQQAIEKSKQVQLNQLTGKEEVKAWQARELAAQERDNKRITEEANKPITALQDAAKDFGRHPLVNEATGGITGEIVTGAEALEKWAQGDNLGAAIGVTKIVTDKVNPLELLPSTIEQMPTKPWHSKNRFLPSAS